MAASLDRLRNDRRLAVAVFFLALAVYLLTYDGSFVSNDERALFSGTDSFVKRGAFTINQIYWDYTHVGVITEHGDMVPNYEPAQMVLAVPFYIWGRALGAAVQGVMFFGVFVMAVSVAMIYLCILELGYRRRTALLSAAVFALGTGAWAYSRSFFRETLTVLAYLVAVYALLRYRPPARRGALWPAVAGIALGIALTNKQVSIAFIPPLLLLAGGYEWQRWRTDQSGRGSRVEWLRDGLAFVVPLSAIWLLGWFYTQTTLRDVSLFARNVVEFASNPQLSSSLPERMLRGSTGLVISPYRGLFWFSPALLLGLAGAVPLLRRRPWEALALLAAVGIHILGYSRYLYWSGGVGWGPRYMLPIEPLLVLLAAPVFAWLLADAPEGASEPKLHAPAGLRSLGAALVTLLLILSVGIQVLGVTVDVRTWEINWELTQAKVYGGIGEAIDALYMTPAQSPVLGHLRLLLSGTQPLDFAWVQLKPEGTWALEPTGLALSLAGVAAALIGFAWLWRRPQWTARLGALLSGAALVLCSGLLLLYRQGDARFDPYNVDRFLQPMNAALGKALASDQFTCCPSPWLAAPDCSAVLVVPDPVLTDYYLDYLRAPLPWYAIEQQPADPELLDELTSRYSDIWLARDRSAAADDEAGWRGTERYLVEHAYKLDEQQFGDWARLIHFSAAGARVASIAAGGTLGEMSLERVDLSLAPAGSKGRCGAATPVEGDAAAGGPVTAQPGDTLQIGLNWRALSRPKANYTVFVQLLDSGSQVKAQRDRWPGDGLYPTTTLTAGQVITDNLAFRLDVPPGRYRLITGLYRSDVDGYPRLTGPAGDTILLSEVDVR